MIFNSLSFLFFFPVVVLLYYLIPSKGKALFLLLASCYFYMAFIPAYILVLLFLISVDYVLARIMDTHEGRARIVFLWISIATNLGTLFFFKYFNFFNENIAQFAKVLHWNYAPVILSIALPIGLSFHVFQSLSYVIEVFRKKYKPETHYVTYALYVMFFPQLVAGPIERPGHLLPQLKIEHRFDRVNARRGLERMLWGFFKKLVIGDKIANHFVNPLYAQLPGDGPTLIFLMIMFSFELYADFSGYSDIAIGSAQVLGIHLSENFDRPYSSASISEFWRRWHISLSSWLRDYLYYPILFSFKKITKAKLYFSLFVTFVLIGLWHGAQWTFVLLGALHGMYLVVGSLTEKIRSDISDVLGFSRWPRLHHMGKVFVTFFLVSFSWIFFRAEQVSQAWYIIANMSTNFFGIFQPQHIKNILFSGTMVDHISQLAIYGSIAFMEIIQYYQAKHQKFHLFESSSKVLRYGWYYALIVVILFFGYFGGSAFIYFKF